MLFPTLKQHHAPCRQPSLAVLAWVTDYVGLTADNVLFLFSCFAGQILEMKCYTIFPFHECRIISCPKAPLECPMFFDYSRVSAFRLTQDTAKASPDRWFYELANRTTSLTQNAHAIKGDFRDSQQWDLLMVSFPYGQGVPFLGVPEHPLIRLD